MPLIYYAVKTRSGERQARLPLTVDGDLGTTIATYSSATFTLDTNAVDCPANYSDYLEPMLYSIVAVEEDAAAGYSKPIWLGMINDTPISSNGSVKIATASLEWYLSTRRAKDARFDSNNDLMDIPKALIAQVEADGVGVGLAVDCPASGTPRFEVIKTSDGQSVVDVFNKLALEWTIAIDWADDTQSHVTKTFKAREPFLGKIVANHPDVVISAPGNLTAWDYTAPMTTGKTATYIVAEGDGTGDTKTTSVPKIDTTREAAGYPRIEVYQQFQGVTNVNDADALADQLSQDFFSRTHIITGTVANRGATAFRRLEIGSSVRIIINDPSKQLDEVWRFVGWTISADGEFWKPTLARLGAKTKAFPRQPSPQDLGRSLVDLNGRVSLGGYQDPIANGYTFPPNADGTSFAIDPSKGFGSYDPSGNWTALTGIGGSGTGGGTTNPGTGTSPGGPTWDFGSEGSDPGAAAVLASSFKLGGTYSLSGSGAYPTCQNEGNLAFATTANNSAFTTKDYSATKPQSVPSDDWGELGIYSGYLQTGQVCDWAQRLTAGLNGSLTDTLIGQSSAAVQPTAIIISGTMAYYGVSKVDVDWAPQPFATSGWLYMPALVTVTWVASSNGTSSVVTKSCVRFLRSQFTSYKALAAVDVCPTAEIGNTGTTNGGGFKTTRAGAQVMIAAPAGSNATSLYAGEFHQGDLWSDGFTVLPAVTGSPGEYTISGSSDGGGKSLYGTAGQLHLGTSITPRTSTDTWFGKGIPGYRAFTSSAGHPVTVSAVWNGTKAVVYAAAFNPDATSGDGLEGVTNPWSSSGSYDPDNVLSYDGWIYGCRYGGYVSAQLIPA